MVSIERKAAHAFLTAITVAALLAVLGAGLAMVAGEEIRAGALDAQSVTDRRMARQVPRRALGTTLPILTCLARLMTSHAVFHRAMEVLSYPTRFTLTIGIRIEPLLAFLAGRRISTFLTVG